jgi:transcriptional regulator with XRE-family HTH domain
MADIPIGKAIRKVRKERGILQKELAGLLGMIDPNGVYQMERGRNNPNLDTIDHYCVALQVEPWHLMKIACELRAELETA